MSGIIVLHDHPSGDPLPSDEDKRIASRLEAVGQLMGIPLLDHVIIGRNGNHYSFADAGAISHEPFGYRGIVLREGQAV